GLSVSCGDMLRRKGGSMLNASIMFLSCARTTTGSSGRVELSEPLWSLLLAYMRLLTSPLLADRIYAGDR
ncbi:uncharacterized protein B0H18DRAFT_1027307, partial [Fomitopsis serialis]|uniref:uncharacterized protein n=1 Tax=Fomitopsis serialis TaxID=139415 RepID=UPI002007B817